MAKKKVKKRTTKKVVKKKAVARKAPAKKVSSGGKRNSLALAIVALILNILIIPGLGSLIGGRTRAGVWQLVLAVVGFILSFILIGVPILIAAWIWGIVTGIRLIQEAQ